MNVPNVNFMLHVSLETTYVSSTIFQLHHSGQLLVEETGVPRENHRPVKINWQTLSHNVSRVYPDESAMNVPNVNFMLHVSLETTYVSLID
jgi:hypothetical protein